MKIRDVTTLNTSLQAEAHRLLLATQLEAALSNFGIVEFSGSFIYGTMVDRDIDIEIFASPDDIHLDSRAKVMEALMHQNKCIGVEMDDRKIYPKPNRPKGIWYGASFLFEDNIWNIDIWLRPDNEPQNELHNKMLHISEEQRNEILMLKHACLLNGQKKKGVTSVEIYRAVINGTSYDTPGD